ncbi:MAG: DUF5671 domain-containing protein [Parcubacteria group bacterium]
MNPQSKSNARDFFLNLGATISLYTVVGSLISLLFTIINNAYPQIVNGYTSVVSSSISWPVAILVIFFPIFILLMWIIGNDYVSEPEKRNSSIHKWLTYATLLIAGLVIAGDLITVLYYFIDGQELTTGFLLKVLVLLVVAVGVFTYYISDIRDRLTPFSRNVWRVVALVAVVGSIVWGFAILGSPATQKLYKYDDQKVNDLVMINSAVENYYSTKNTLPKDFAEIETLNYGIRKIDPQTQKQYTYTKTGNTTYEVCAEFNKSTDTRNGNNAVSYPYQDTTWTHPAGAYCFQQKINPSLFPNPKF